MELGGTTESAVATCHWQRLVWRQATERSAVSELNNKTNHMPETAIGVYPVGRRTEQT
jgi:hypothetical protein